MRQPAEAVVLGFPLPYLTMGWAGRGARHSLAILGLDLLAWTACAAAGLWLLGRFRRR